MKKIMSRSLICIITILVLAGLVYYSPYSAKINMKFNKYSAQLKSKYNKYNTLKKLNKAVDTIGREGIFAEKNLYSLFWEELIIRDFFQDRQGGFFVDVGCYEPIAGSNTYYLEKHLGWTGIGIDALNDYATAWQEERPKSRFFNFLVTEDSEGTGEFYKSEAKGLSSVHQDHADASIFEGISKGQIKTEKIQVKKISLTDLFDREGIKKIDLLSLDIEGHEFWALKGLDLERFSPELIITEGVGTTDEVIQYLERHDYHRIKRYQPFEEWAMCFSRKKGPEAISKN